jgi:hypothetical protein
VRDDGRNGEEEAGAAAQAKGNAKTFFGELKPVGS